MTYQPLHSLLPSQHGRPSRETITSHILTHTTRLATPCIICDLVNLCSIRHRAKRLYASSLCPNNAPRDYLKAICESCEFLIGSSFEPFLSSFLNYGSSSACSLFWCLLSKSPPCYVGLPIAQGTILRTTLLSSLTPTLVCHPLGAQISADTYAPPLLCISGMPRRDEWNGKSLSQFHV